MRKDIAIIHYNTPRLTQALVSSIRKFTPDANIVIFDNSDRNPFPKLECVTVIDNTKGQVVNFESMIEHYPNRRRTINGYASAKHIASVDALFDLLPKGFLLLDSDVLLMKDVSEFFDDTVAWKGYAEKYPDTSYHHVRLLPYCLWINVPMLKKHDIRFWHDGMVDCLDGEPPYYDTGSSLLYDCRVIGLPGCQMDIYDYVIHFGRGSYDKTEILANQWLERYKHLYTMEEIKNKTKKAAPKKEKILVVIPYCSAGAQGRELEYAVAGWRMHFKEDYLIVIAGERHPVCDTGDDIICIESERVKEKPGNYRQHLDYVSCFRKVREAFPKSKGFIFVADDCYAVNDFDMSDVMLLKQKGDDIGGDPNSSNGWIRDKAKTKALLIKEGYPTRNFTTHLPQWFEWDKLIALYDKYDMDNNSYVFEDLYYNICFPTRIPLQLHIDHDNFKCGIYRRNPRIEYIDRAFKKQIWIQNSPEGWIPALEQRLKRHYGIE